MRLQRGVLRRGHRPVGRVRPGPVARAVRADTLTLAGFVATLGLSREPVDAIRDIPVLRMLTLGPEELAARAVRLAAACTPSLRPAIEPGESAVGGGSFPGALLPTTLVTLDAGALGPDGLALRLRLGEPAVVARVGGGRVLLDPRTLPEESFAGVGIALKEALRE